jgi:hypothetical protein
MEEFVPLTPIHFFQIGVDCHRVEGRLTAKNWQKYGLPLTSELCGEWAFAEVALGWSVEGIDAFISVDQPVHRVAYPNVTQGDSVELFFDTRDVKTSGFNTRFCHHFFFLPEAVEGEQAGEISRFRGEERHELCDPKELVVKASLKPSGYTLQIFIPRSCLYAYDPDQFDRLGFTYRINRASGPPQHFSIVSEDYAIEQQPSLWSSLRLLA